jgi:TRAP-type transport system periplasmic protein
MRISRRSLLGGAATAFASRGARAQSAEFAYKLAHNQPTTHPLHIQLAEAAKRIKADTGGKVDI